ncbi:sigma-70 family RNA polymerase sigma factor [Sneathiella limimaris]|uniref:sigma-70 family RNA polymerase sigma factor n=1 Tax=Sneathiella limimaris TaxID=1964213 RepID=UPI00146A6AA1|nr:sigma-70 family RNA polymerase sigma factor [Sneathiella limimaris]
MASSDSQGDCSPSTQSDAFDLNVDLVRVAEHADRAAYRRIFLHMAPKVKTFLLKSGLSPAECEEVLQDTMMKVWRKAALFDRSKSAASTWIYSIARNARIDRIRKEYRPLPDPEDPSFVPDPPETGEEAVSREQNREMIQEALSSLPSEQIEIITMSFFEEKSHAEISEALNLPLGTVKSRIRLAFGKIRARLEAM